MSEGTSSCSRDAAPKATRIEAQILDATPSAWLMVDHEGNIVRVNRVLERLFDYPAGALIGKPVEVLLPERYRSAHPQQRHAFFREPAARPLGRGRDLYGLRRNGQEFAIEIGLNPIRTAEGLFALAAIVDISERKKLEEEQRQLNAELKRAISALTSSNVELKQFAYIASHDLQSPLRSIAGFAQFLERDYKGRLDEKADDYIDRIVKGCKRLQTLIHDLLAYTRVDSAAEAFEPVDLNLLCDEIIEALDVPVDEGQPAVTHGPLPVVQGDASQLSQLLQNLIDNGLKYHGDNRAVVRITAEREAGCWKILVRDNGIGIAPQHHEQIFEVFRRLHSRNRFPGTGIGLAVCRQIVTRHGGRIGLSSEVGKGSTFHFTLPGADESAHE